jgi:hypothetical protein
MNGPIHPQYDDDSKLMRASIVYVAASLFAIAAVVALVWWGVS